MDDLPPPLEAPPETLKPPATSFFARLLNVFAVPSLVFEEVKASPARISNWLLPAFLCAIVGTAAAFVLFSQPEIQKKLWENQAKVLEKRVQSGYMTEADATKAKNLLMKVTVPGLTLAAGVLGFGRAFWWAFILWMFGLTFLKSRFGFVKGLEVAGLATMISVLGSIVVLLLSVDLGQLTAGHYMSLSVSEAALNRRSLLIGGAIDVFAIWSLAVMSVGLSRLTGAPFLRTAWLVFACWVLQQLFLLLMGAGPVGA